MDPTFQPGTATMPSSKVEISVECRNLKNKDTFSKSDPMCVLSVSDAKTRQSHEIGRTEMIKDTLDPNFVKKFIVDYFFEERQMMTFSVGCGQGHIIVRCEEVSTTKDEVTLQLAAHKLDKKDFFGKSDPFLLLHRVNEDRSCTVVHKTEVVRSNLNPVWRPFTISVQALCNGDYDRSIQIECYDWDSDGSHDFIGAFSTNMRELSRGSAEANTFEVINPKKQAKKKSYKDSGQIRVMSCSIQQRQSFLDYIRGGMQMNFTVAIDFTASNGNPSHPSSLHYMNPYQPNQYAAAIQAVGEIIQDYDTDKMFPVLGFGAKLPGGTVSHEFAVNFVPENPYCAGVGGILQSYQSALPRVQLYGPTNFSPVINHVARFASGARDGSSYFVLLIITDGEITDMTQTKSAIVAASRLPMSIIIVGVGNAEFDAMDILDSDNCLLRDSSGAAAERDIVQTFFFAPERPKTTTRHRLILDRLVSVFRVERHLLDRPGLDHTPFVVLSGL
ncbi:hypothetical protein ACOMHN_050146 [Nucella lapillus]